MSEQEGSAIQGGSLRSVLPGPRNFPYRSRLLSTLSELILVWDSPALQEEILAKSGEALDQASHQALRHLFAWGPIRPSVLAEALGTGASNVSKIVRRLADDGYVEREADVADGRACLITLTPRGETAAREVYGLGDRMIAEVLEGWPLDDVRQYTALTERFVSDVIESAVQMRGHGLDHDFLTRS